MFETKLHSRFLAVITTSLLCVASALSINAQNGYFMSMPDVTANGGGTVTVPVSLTNATGIFSLQIEVYLPDGVDIVNVEGSDRTVNAEFFNFSQNDLLNDDNQRYRRIYIANIQNMMSSAIEGNEGELIYITFQLPEGEGTYPIQLKNLQFINPPTYAIEYMNDVEATITAKDYYFTMPDVQAGCGETIIVPLNLHNVGGIYSIQIDLMLADGVEFVDATLGDRVSAEFFQYGSEDKYTEDNVRYRRVVFANLMNTASTVSGNEGTVVNYTLKVQPNHNQDTYPLRVMNIQFFNPPTYAIEYIDDAEATIYLSPSSLLGDVNHDGEVSIADVTDLINFLLTGEGNACEICSDVNNDNEIAIADVTALIHYLLTGNW